MDIFYVILPFTAHPLGPKLTTPTMTAVSSVALAGITKGPPESPRQESLLVPSLYKVDQEEYWQTYPQTFTNFYSTNESSKSIYFNKFTTLIYVIYAKPCGTLSIWQKIYSSVSRNDLSWGLCLCNAVPS